MNELTITEVEEKIVQLVMNKLSRNEQPSRDDSLKALGLNSVQNRLFFCYFIRRHLSYCL
ncbi:hypothetical protein BSAF29S_07219 [Bacillus safensis subsp. safensis]